MLRDGSRSTKCSAGQDGAASSGSSNSFSIQAENRFSVSRFQTPRKGQTLPSTVPGRGRRVGAHRDLAGDGAAAGAGERRAPGPGGRRLDLGQPEIRRAAVALARARGDVAVGRDQRKLAVGRLLGGE